MLEPNHSVASEILPSVGILLAKRLRSWREQRDIPIKRAAAELGVSFATWDRWEKGRRFPGMDDLNFLAQYLCLPPCFLLYPVNRAAGIKIASSTNCRIRMLGNSPMLNLSYKNLSAVLQAMNLSAVLQAIASNDF